MKKWIWIFTVILLSIGIIYWSEQKRFNPAFNLLDQQQIVIVDSQAQTMIDRLWQRDTNDVRGIIEEFRFMIVPPDSGIEYQAKSDQTLMISYQELTARPELTDAVKRWIGQGARIYFYGDEIYSRELGEQFEIPLYVKSAEEHAVGIADGGAHDLHYQVIAYQQGQPREVPSTLFAHVDIALEKERIRTFNPPSAAPDAFLQTVLLDLQRQKAGQLPRNDFGEKSEFQEPLVMGEDLMSALYLSQTDGKLLLLADIASHVDVYQHLKEGDLDHDYFVLTHGTQVTTYNQAQSKRLEVHHGKATDRMHLSGMGPHSQKGRTFDAMIYKELRWSYENRESVELRSDYSMPNHYASWSVTPRWWKRDIGREAFVVPGTFWATPDTYLAVDVTQRAQIGHGFHEYWTGVTHTVRYEYEKRNVMP